MFPASLARIYEHHCVFLKKLEERVSDGKWQCVIADVIDRFIQGNDVRAKSFAVLNCMRGNTIVRCINNTS